MKTYHIHKPPVEKYHSNVANDDICCDGDTVATIKDEWLRQIAVTAFNDAYNAYNDDQSIEDDDEMMKVLRQHDINTADDLESVIKDAATFKINQHNLDLIDIGLSELAAIDLQDAAMDIALELNEIMKKLDTNKAKRSRKSKG